MHANESGKRILCASETYEARCRDVPYGESVTLRTVASEYGIPLESLKAYRKRHKLTDPNRRGRKTPEIVLLANADYEERKEAREPGLNMRVVAREWGLGRMTLAYHRSNLSRSKRIKPIK